MQRISELPVDLKQTCESSCWTQRGRNLIHGYLY